MQLLPISDLKRFISVGSEHLTLVFLSACHLQRAAQAIVNAGVPHVICCSQEELFRDEGAIQFTRNFFRALACKQTLKQAFLMAREAVQVSPALSNEHAMTESEKYLLLPTVRSPRMTHIMMYQYFSKIG
jgi:hypothetical protein